MDLSSEPRHMGLGARLSAFAEDHGRNKPVDQCAWRTLRSSKEGASADSAEQMKDTTGVNPWRLHFIQPNSMVKNVHG